jgi:hypothetical protein
MEPDTDPATDAAIPPVISDGQSSVLPPSLKRFPTSKIQLHRPMIIAAALYGVGLISVVLFFAATRRPGPLADIVLPPTIPPTSTVIVSSPTVTATPVPTRVSTATPAPTRVLQPPTDRNTVPADSLRLGEFAVESYCNSRGDGVVIVNHQADWACTNPSNGMPVMTLGPKDFDAICQGRYNDQTAFAIRDQQKPQKAYDWSCYAYAEPTATLVATPSIASLLPQFSSEWVALVNVANYPLATDGIVFKREDGNTLKGTEWGQAILPPGACLRLYAGPNAPSTPPARCSNVIDYPGAKDAGWATSKVTITINPSTAYCYPSDQCGK